MDNIHPIHDRMLQRAEREKRLGQRGGVVWLYGLSGSGKSTLAIALEKLLHRRGYVARVLDGDNIRTGLNSNLGFTDDDRRENIRRVAEVAKLFTECGIVTIASFICPLREMRDLARGVIGAEDFLEVYVHATPETCARRDPKGLYKKVAEGGIRHFTGKDSAFESPLKGDPDRLWIDTETADVEESVKHLCAEVEARFPRFSADNTH